jgi:hypothetical protein
MVGIVGILGILGIVGIVGIVGIDGIVGTEGLLVIVGIFVTVIGFVITGDICFVLITGVGLLFKTGIVEGIELFCVLFVFFRYGNFNTLVSSSIPFF